MPFVDRNQIVQAFSPNRPDEPFAKRIRLWEREWRPDRPNAEVLQRAVQGCRENRVAIVNDESVRMWFGENLPELLGGPFGGRMGGHVEVQNPS